jgi:uncharacterized protein
MPRQSQPREQTPIPHLPDASGDNNRDGPTIPDIGGGSDDEPELSGPLRRCALTRAEKPIAELIRFGAGPDGIVVPDLALRLPGRGVWVDGHRASVAEAVKRNVFARSLKRTVTAPANLPDTIDALLVKRVLSALSLANKAGLVTPGFAQVDEALEGGRVAGLLHGAEAAPDGRDRLDRKYRAISLAMENPCVIVTELTIDQISLAIGRSNVVHAAITSGGAATRLLDEAGRLIRFRSSPDGVAKGVNTL